MSSYSRRHSRRYQLDANAVADYFSAQGFRWQLNSQWNRFEHKDIEQVEGTRASIMPSVSYPVYRPWGFLIPKISYQSTDYQQKSRITGESLNISRNMPVLSLDSGLHFDRNSQWFEEDYTHSLSPRLFYSYIPYRDQSQINVFDSTRPSFEFNQLWRENRFSGIDRIGDTNHISVALANSLVRNQSGEQVFDFSLGRKYYFDDRLVQSGSEAPEESSGSPWLAQLSFRLSSVTSFDGFIEWDQRSENTNQARSRIKFEPRAHHIVNVSHRYRDIAGQISEESDFSFAWPINDSWRLVGRWYNDLRRNQTIEALAGVEYESCCWAVRLVAQRYLNTQLDSRGFPITTGSDEYSEGVHLQFVFKGLGSAGESGLNGLLESSITGYRDPFLNRERSY